MLVGITPNEQNSPFSQVRPAEVLKLEDIAVRDPAPNELRIKVAAIGLNFAEVMWRQNQYIETPRLPSGLGYEVSGYVEKLGPGVQNFRVGNKVATFGNYVRGNGICSDCRVYGRMNASTEARSRHSANSVGRLLRDWRASRGISQLDLALRSGFSARHVSFIETGRTQPSRQALLVLAETMEVPLREEMEHIRSVLQFILDRHKPYAAVVLDRYSNCLMGNGESLRLLEAVVDESLITGNANHLRMVFRPLGARRCIVNWSEVARHLLARAQRESRQFPDDPTALALLAELQGYLDPSSTERQPAPFSAADLLLPIHIRKDDVELRLFSTIMTLGTPQDVTLQELRVETFFPADEVSENAWRRLRR